MDVLGQRILIFGDSLSHHSRDDAAEIWDVDAGTNRTTSAPGDLLASILLEQGAQAVRTDANVGRSAHNFWAGTSRHQFSSAADLIASDQAWGPTKVIVMLGTNDADSGVIDAAAMKQIRDAYAGMGAEVWAIGPPVFANATLTAKADQVYTMMAGIFGDKLIDARPLSSVIGRASDGVHFQPTAAQQFALQLASAVLTTRSSIFSRKPWLGAALGVGVIGLLAYAIWKTYEGRQLGDGSNEPELEGITIKPAGLRTIEIDVTNIDDGETDALDDVIDEVGHVTSQVGNKVYVTVDDRDLRRARDRFMRYAEGKGIFVRDEGEGDGLNGSKLDKKTIKDALTTAGLPVPAGSLLDASYRMRTNDWYVQTDRGWFWWDDRKREWKTHPTGPLGDAKLDKKIARQSLKEERKAIHDYGQRITKAESPKLKKALRHARGEERQHAAAFRPLV